MPPTALAADLDDVVGARRPCASSRSSSRRACRRTRSRPSRRCVISSAQLKAPGVVKTIHRDGSRRSCGGSHAAPHLRATSTAMRGPLRHNRARASCPLPRAHEPRLPPHLRALVPLGRALHPRLPRQDLRRRDRRRADRRRQARRLRAGPGDPARDGHQAGAGARLPAAGRTSSCAPRATRRASATACASPTRSRSTARRRPPASCASRSRPRSRRACRTRRWPTPRARGVGQLPHRAAGGHRRRRRLHAQRPGAQGRRRGDPRAPSTSARWCCCRRSASRRPARPST